MVRGGWTQAFTQVLAGCAPTLVEEVEGRLGRPLSEAPEFWRAAPEAAVLWGEDEFEFPPSPRGGRRQSRLPQTLTSIPGTPPPVICERPASGSELGL